jgi:hypothetical protein
MQAHYRGGFYAFSQRFQLVWYRVYNTRLQRALPRSLCVAVFSGHTLLIANRVTQF